MSKHNAKKLKDFLKKPPFENEENLLLWENSQRDPSLSDFAICLRQGFGRQEATSDKLLRMTKGQNHSCHLERSPSETRMESRDISHTLPFLPIERLREGDSLSLFQGNTSYRTFLSSGTTSHLRSHSHYSHDGLLFYKAQCLKYFSDIMKKLFDEEAMNVHGISLIPSLEGWPDKSLAQMLTWFSEFWDLKFLSLDNFQQKDIDTNTKWIFTTPFQLVDIFDSGKTFKFPPNSVLFETGGTKGKSRDLEKDEIYKKSIEHFSISSERIVSEYGMCELSSQAYSVGSGRFQFPRWVEVSVSQGLGEILSEGEGALIVDDPLRIDYPWPLRTQDIVRLHKDQSFEILGRVPKSVLKGCSLLTENTTRHLKQNPKDDLPRHLLHHSLSDEASAKSESKAERSPQSLRHLHHSLSDEALAKSESKAERPPQSLRHLHHSLSDEALAKSESKAERSPQNTTKLAQKLLISILEDISFREALTNELKSENAAREALSDLKNSTSSLNWEDAIQKSHAKKGEHWLIIAPNNHSIATLYTLLIGFAAGLKFTVRVPKAFEEKNSFLNLVLDWIQKESPGNIHTLPSNFRIGQDRVPDGIQKACIFGEDSTISSLKALLPIPVAVFGSGITFSILDSDSDDNAKLIAKDFLSLGQQGCLSSRAVFVCFEKEKIPCFLEKLQKECKNFWNTDFLTFTRVALDHEKFSLDSKEIETFPRKSHQDSLFTIYNFEDVKDQLTKTLSKLPFVLPVIHCESQENLIKHMEEYTSLCTLSCTAELRKSLQKRIKRKIRICDLGLANSPTWDGMDKGSPLFQTSR